MITKRFSLLAKLLKSALLSATCTISLLATSTFAYASNEVTIQDSGGFTRAQSVVDENGQVEFNLVDAAGSPADGVEVTLTNSITGESLSAISANGSVAFETVAPGTWTVATPAAGVTFTNVTVASAAALVAGVAPIGVVAGGLAAAGGTTAVAVTAATNNDSKKPLSPSS